MPSGSKKRKAAKKKKEKQQANSSLHGDDDLKVIEENERDSGETNSPLSQDNKNNQHFDVGEEKKEEETSSSIQTAVTQSESVDQVKTNGEVPDKVTTNEKNGTQTNEKSGTQINEKSGTQIDGEIKLDDVSVPKATIVEYIEIEDVTTTSTSSSDDESKSVDKNIEVINWEEPIEYAPNLPTKADPIESLKKKADPIADLEKDLPEAVSQILPEESNEVLKADANIDLVTEKSKVEISGSVSETSARVEPVLLSKEENRVDGDLDGKSGSLEVPSSGIDMRSQAKVDIVSSNVEDQSKIRPESSVSAADATSVVNGAENKKYSEIESRDRPIPLELPTRPVQTTASWMNCCGLCDLFTTGSNR